MLSVDRYQSPFAPELFGDSGANTSHAFATAEPSKKELKKMAKESEKRAKSAQKSAKKTEQQERKLGRCDLSMESCADVVDELRAAVAAFSDGLQGADTSRLRQHAATLTDDAVIALATACRATLECAFLPACPRLTATSGAPGVPSVRWRCARPSEMPKPARAPRRVVASKSAGSSEVR